MKFTYGTRPARLLWWLIEFALYGPADQIIRFGRRIEYAGDRASVRLWKHTPIPEGYEG